MHQKIILIGNLGGDIEVRQTDAGVPVANFRLATNERWRNDDGTLGERTNWFEIAVFGEYARNHSRHIKKGSLVYVEGRVSGARTWIDKTDGHIRAIVQVKADTIRYLSSPTNGARVEDSLRKEDENLF